MPLAFHFKLQQTNYKFLTSQYENFVIVTPSPYLHKMGVESNLSKAYHLNCLQQF